MCEATSACWLCCAVLELRSLMSSVIFVNEDENGEKRENNEFVNEN